MDGAPRKSYEGFMNTNGAKVVGLLLAFLLSYLLMFIGAYKNICLYLLAGIILFAIPRIFGVKKFVTMAALGVVFMIVVTAVGTLGYTEPTMMDNKDTSFSEGGFSNVVVTETTEGFYSIQADYTGSGDVEFVYGKVGTSTFNVIFNFNYKTIDQVSVPMTMSGGHYVTTSDVQLADGTVFAAHFKCGDNTTGSFIVSENVSDNDIMMNALYGNAYITGLLVIVYFLILVLTTLMRKSLDKTRAKLEAEGRLYPQGYGRCKECGMLVLPGETVCRKCGTLIDVPDEFKVIKKADSFRCSECNAEIPSDAKACPKCGAQFDEGVEEAVVEVSETKTEEFFECSECGAKVPADAEKCPKCGAQFDEEERE